MTTPYRWVVAAIIAAFIAALPVPARAQVECPYNSVTGPWYWSVTDSSPSTQVWAGDAGDFVALADGTYTAWVAQGCVTTTIDTAVNLNAVINSIALSRAVAGQNYAVNTNTGSGVDITLTNQVALQQVISFSGGGHSLNLPQMNLPISAPIGFAITVTNPGTQNFLVKDFSGATVATSSAKTVMTLVVDSNASQAGSFQPFISIVYDNLSGSTQWPCSFLPTFTGDLTIIATPPATGCAGTVAKINGETLGSTTPTAGNLLVGNGSQWVSTSLATDSGHVDATVCQDTTSKTFYFGSGALGVCLGTSGRQFKTDFAPMQAGLAEITRIPLWNYRYRAGFGDNGAAVQYGATAQDVEQVLPGLARHDSAGATINYDWAGLLFVGLRGIQELKAENDDLRAEIAQIRRQLERRQ